MTTSIIKAHQHANTFSLYNSKLIPNFKPGLLAPDHWEKMNEIIGTAQGRGTTYFISHEQQQWVLRHYFRGGLIGKFNKDSYFFTSLEKTRAFLEFNLLETMQHLALPVPKPVACRVVKKGLFYHADLLTTRVENAKDLVAILTENALDNAIWLQIGQMIRRFHHHGIYHHDLNAHNILLDDKGVVSLIDFDRGEQRSNNETNWQQANLTRLLRSFRKEKTKLPQFFWQEENWQQLMHGYRKVEN